MKWFTLLFFLAEACHAYGSETAEMLAKAARDGDLATLASLLSSGATPDAADRFGHTPLYYAASFDRTNAVELLLASHAEPNLQAAGHPDMLPVPATPLQYAAELGNRHIASLLIEAGARVNEAGPTGRTALHFANDHLDLMQLLIRQGADVNARDREGTSPLDQAVWYGSLDTAALLLAHGAHLNEREPKTGATPINEAAFRGQIALVRYLLPFGPDLEIPDKNGRRPVDNAIRMGNQEAAVLLLNAEPQASQTPQSLATGMEAAIRKDEAAVVENLLGRGVSANSVLPSNATPLDAAAFQGSIKAAGALLEHGADPNSGGTSGNLPLEDASLKGFDGVAAALLDHGANVNRASAGSGTTALYSAAAFGRAKVVELLLQRGADPNVCGAHRKNAYEAALENGYTGVASLLQQHGAKKHCAP